MIAYMENGSLKPYTLQMHIAPNAKSQRVLVLAHRRVTGAFSKLRAVYGKWAWLAGRRRGAGVLNIIAAAWTPGFQWWRSANITRKQNVSEYMLVLALWLVVACRRAA